VRRADRARSPDTILARIVNLYLAGDSSDDEATMLAIRWPD
jgi:hypothetical protein